MRHFNDEELAALDRIVARLEAWLEEYGDTDAASVVLVEEELMLMRAIVAGGGTSTLPVDDEGGET